MIKKIKLDTIKKIEKFIDGDGSLENTWEDTWDVIRDKYNDDYLKLINSNCSSKELDNFKAEERIAYFLKRAKKRLAKYNSVEL